MVFKRDPVVSPGSQSISFDNKVITHASYSENNGDAELDVAANEPLMASFADDRKTIVISAVIAPVQQTPAAPSGVGTGTGTGSQNPAQARSAANSAAG